MPILELKNITKKYRNAEKFAVDNISMSVEKGEILALVGESGSGKTTLLRLIAGLEHPEKGTIVLDDNIISEGSKSLPANLRRIGMVFQDYALFPHMNIGENIAYGLSKLSKEERKKRIEDTLKLVNLDEEITKYPHHLSGGQQQRVALARAIAPQPEILLLDEPFSNLDSILRDQVREEVKSIVKKLGITAILVTHDTKDALSMADKIVVLNKGLILQHDRPEMLYEKPSNPYVASIFGKYTTLLAKGTNAGYEMAFGILCTEVPFDSNENIQIFFRPEHTMIVDLEFAQLKGKVLSISYQGDQKLLTIQSLQEPESVALISSASHLMWEVGDMVGFSIVNFKVDVFLI